MRIMEHSTDTSKRVSFESSKRHKPFVDRLLLALRYLNEKDTLKVVEKLI